MAWGEATVDSRKTETRRTGGSRKNEAFLKRPEAELFESSKTAEVPENAEATEDAGTDTMVRNMKRNK